jgi:sortase (surface protein transpeptidase)
VVAWLAGVGAVLVVAAGGAGARAAMTPDEPAQAAPVDGSPSVPPVARKNPAAGGSWGPVTSQSPVAAPSERAPAAHVRPLSVTIPAIGVTSSLVPLALRPTGELAAPADFGRAGWYAEGPTPGDPGPAVIAGHVDSRAGPAVFFRLRELQVGDVVEVRRSDGTAARFSVTGMERYPKAHFPTQRVHGPTPDRALRLITCGGSFDYAMRSYRDNVVVYAVRR